MGNHMDQEKLQLAKLVVKATIFIAACAMFHWAGAQNATENAQAVAARDAKELAERNRIAQERAKATKDYEAAREACYQQFAVNACLTTARNNYNTQVADLKRQDNSLSDVQRKRRGAEQVQRTEDKIANARPAQVPPQRGNALAAEPKRSDRQAQPKAAVKQPLPSKPLRAVKRRRIKAKWQTLQKQKRNRYSATKRPTSTALRY
jgi:hypothetical protein